MKFHNIRMVGPFNNEHLSSLPVFDASKDQGRMVWLEDGSLWYGEIDRWVKILAGDGGGGTIHNDLDGRSDNDCHPVSAITGLEEALRYAGMRWELIDNQSWNIQDHVGYLVDTTSGAVTATLPSVSGTAPSASLGMVTEIVDMAGSFDSNKVTVITPDNELIMGLNEPLEIDTEWASATLVYSDQTHGWIVTDGKSGGCESSGGLGGIQWNIIDANTNAQPFNGYFVDTEVRSVRLTLTSTPEEGDIIKVIDYNGFAHTNNIVIDANGYKIAGSTNDFVLNVDNTSLTLIYSDADEGWVIESIYKDTGIQWNKIDSNTNALIFNGYFVDTENTSVTLTLPSSPKQGSIIKVIDYNGFANTNNIFIDPNGGKINGDTNAFVMSVDHGSVTLIYSDADEGWLVENAYKTSETGGGIIDYDMTIYLAPDTVDDSPTGVVGSDITGDGSDTKPFFSIKRAMEYLSDYRIKPGVYVSIRGLPGVYNYTEQHAVEVKHKDAKYIKVEFDMLESGYYLDTDIDDSQSIYIDDSNYDSTTGTGYIEVTFYVNDMGTGYNQIQAGDYIKLSSDDEGVYNRFERCSWNGYHLVTSTNYANKKVRVIMKYYGYYSSSFQNQIFPSFPDPATDNINVYKYSTQINIDITDTSLLKNGYFFYSEYGFGSIQINASNINHWNPYDSTSRNCGFVYIYDGVVNDVILNLNGFSTGAYFINLLCNFDESDIDRLFSSFTSCYYGMYFNQSKVNIKKITCDHGSVGLYFDSSSVTFDSDARVSSFINHSGNGIILESSDFESKIAYDQIKKILTGYNASGFGVRDNSSAIFRGVYIFKCYYGYLVRKSIIRTFTSTSDDLSNLSNQQIGNCYFGIYLYEGSSGFIRNQSITWCTSDAIYSNNSSIECSTYDTYVYGCKRLLYAYRSTIKIDSAHVDNCNVDGIFAAQSYMEVSNSEIENCDYKGIYFLESQGRVQDCNIHDNGYGVYVKTSIVRLTNNSSSGVYDNDTYNIECYAGGQINIYTDNDITNTNPAANTSPSTSGYNSMNYIGMTVY